MTLATYVLAAAVFVLACMVSADVAERRRQFEYWRSRYDRDPR